MRCKNNPCLSLIDLLLKEQFKKESNMANIEDAMINFSHMKQYFKILKDPTTDHTYYFRRVRAHMFELDNYLKTGSWKRDYG